MVGGERSVLYFIIVGFSNGNMTYQSPIIVNMFIKCIWDMSYSIRITSVSSIWLLTIFHIINEVRLIQNISPLFEKLWAKSVVVKILWPNAIDYDKNLFTTSNKYQIPLDAREYELINYLSILIEQFGHIHILNDYA